MESGDKTGAGTQVDDKGQDEGSGEKQGYVEAAATQEGYDLTIRGEFQPKVLTQRPSGDKYKAAANQTAYKAAVAGAGANDEVYRMTWNTKLFSCEDVVLVVTDALKQKCRVNSAATAAAQKYDCRGPKWGVEPAKELDPDVDKYEVRESDKLYNGGGTTLVTSPMGNLRVKLVVDVTMARQDGEEFKALMCVELEHDAASQYGGGEVADQGYLLAGFYRAEMTPNARNAALAKALNELEPRIGVQVRADKVTTRAKFMLLVRAGGPPELVKAFRKKLLAGTQIMWAGQETQVRIGSEMDVEKYRNAQRENQQAQRLQRDEAEAGKKLVVKNLQPDILRDAKRLQKLRDLCQGYCTSGEDLLEFEVMMAKSGKSAFAWACYRTTEELESALQGNNLREDVTDEKDLAWGTAYVSIKATQEIEVAGKEGSPEVKKVWYEKPKEIAASETGVPTLNLTQASSIQDLWKNSMADGTMAKAFGGLMAAEVKGVLGKVESALQLMQQQREDDRKRLDKLEKQELARKKDAKSARELQRATNKLLERMLNAAGGGTQQQRSKVKARKRAETEEEDSSDAMSEDDDEVAPDSVKKMKPRKMEYAEAAGKGMSHKELLGRLLKGIGVENLASLEKLGVDASQVQSLVEELGLTQDR